MHQVEQLYNEWKSLQPLKDDDQLRLNRKFMLEFNYNSNHLEGNTLTYGQTEILLLFGKVVDAANMKDLEDMKASNVGLNMMKEQALSEYPLTESFIRQLHQTILREDYTVYRTLPGGQQTSYVVHAGIYKTRPNSVRTQTGELFEYASPEETPALMTDLVQWYNEEERKGTLSLAELCALFHYRYIRIHPFEDGNGRIARLLVNYILSRHDYPITQLHKSAEEVWNVLEFVFLPLAEEFSKAVDSLNSVFRFSSAAKMNRLSKTVDAAGGLHVNEVMRSFNDTKVADYVDHAQSMWFTCKMTDPQEPHRPGFNLEKAFYIRFFDDYYFVDGILNKNFPYGKYPTEEDKRNLVSQFKQDLIDELRNRL